MPAEDQPLIPDSTTRLVERARKALHEPASPESKRVGVLLRLDRLARASAEACDAARLQTSGDLKRRVEQLGAAQHRLADLAGGLALALGGGPADDDKPTQLMHDAKSFAYCRKDADVIGRLEDNRAAIERARRELEQTGEPSGPLADAFDEAATIDLTS